MDEFEYDWEVTEIITPTREDRRAGAMVTYTPLTAGCTPQIIFVPVPWHKATDQAHAREIMERKINSRAPTHIWNKQLNPDPVDQTDVVTADMVASLPTGEKRGAVNTEGSGDGDGVSGPSRSQGE